MKTLTPTQQNYCNLNNLNETECQEFWTTHTSVDYSMLNSEQKSICDLYKYSNNECLTYWVGKDDGTPPGTKPKEPEYSDLNEEQKEYCSLRDISNSECVKMFFDDYNYNLLTSNQKQYCSLNGLTNDKCVFHFMKKDEKNAEQIEQEWIENEKQPQVLYFDNESYNNANLKIKNNANSSICSYTVIKGNNLKNYKNFIKNRIGSDFEEFTRTEDDLSNITMEHSYQETAWVTLNSRDKKEPTISKIIVDLEAPSGLYKMSDSGTFRSASVNVLVQITGWNASYTTPIRYYFYRTLASNTTYSNDKYTNMAIRSFPSIQRETSGDGKSPKRWSYTFDLPSGYYQIKIIRNSKNSFHDSKLSNNFNLKRVVSVFDLTSNYKDVTLLAVKLTSNQQFSGSSALKVNCLVRKNSNNTDSYFSSQVTLRDFIYDIWTNKKTGMGEDINALDIRADLQENCNLVLEQDDVSINVIKDVLAGYGYVFYPNNNTFVIEKDQPKTVRNYIFHEGNYSKISFNYSIPQESELGNGIRVKYIPQGQMELVEYTYPNNADNPREVILKGVSIASTAEATAKRMYKKDTLRAKTCIIETDLEGFIPELNSRVAVSSKYLKNTITTNMEKIEYILNGEQVQTKVFLPDNVTFDLNKTKINVLTKRLTKIDSYPIIPFNGLRNYFLINGIIELDIDEHIIIIGEEKEFLEDYTLESITPTQDSEGNIERIKLELIEYNPSIYLD